MPPRCFGPDSQTIDALPPHPSVERAKPSADQERRQDSSLLSCWQSPMISHLQNLLYIMFTLTIRDDPVNKRCLLLFGLLSFSGAVMTPVACIAAPMGTSTTTKAQPATSPARATPTSTAAKATPTSSGRKALPTEHPGQAKKKASTLAPAPAAVSGTEDGIHYALKLPAGFEQAQSKSENRMTTITWINKSVVTNGIVPTIELTVWELPEGTDAESVSLEKAAQALLQSKQQQWNKFDYGKGTEAKLNGRLYFRNTYVGKKVRWLSQVNGIQYVTKIGGKVFIATVQDALSSSDTLTTSEAALKTLKLSAVK